MVNLQYFLRWDSEIESKTFFHGLPGCSVDSKYLPTDQGEHLQQLSCDLDMYIALSISFYKTALKHPPKKRNSLILKTLI